MYSAMDIARYILTWFYDNDEFISNLKLQKLLYYIQGHCLGMFSHPCFNDTIQAWKHGPVVPTVYRKFSSYAGGSIIYFDRYNQGEINENIEELIDDVLEHYGEYETWDLVDMTHREGPWRGCYVDGMPDIEITKESMQEWFEDERL